MKIYDKYLCAVLYYNRDTKHSDKLINRRKMYEKEKHNNADALIPDVVSESLRGDLDPQTHRQ